MDQKLQQKLTSSIYQQLHMYSPYAQWQLFIFLCTTDFLNIEEASCHVHTQGNQVPCGEASARLEVGDASVRGPEDGRDTFADWETQAGGSGQWTDPSHIQVNYLSIF